MRRTGALLLALMLLLAAGCGLADETVQLPESRYEVTLPDGMEYDGPTPDSQEAFAWVSEEMGLEISFFRYEKEGTEPAVLMYVLMMALMDNGAEDIGTTTVNGVEMVVYRFPPADESGMKGIGYILQDGDALQGIMFWYATQEAAEMTRTIMESIGVTETV